MGDPRGIGPEVVGKALASLIPELPPDSFLVLGPSGSDPALTPFEAIGNWDGTEAGAGRVTVDAIRRGVNLALEGTVAAIITGPSHKPAIQAAGWSVPGQTELLQALSKAKDVGMLMSAERTRAGGALRVLLATTHIPLRELFQHLTKDVLLRKCRLLSSALTSDWGFERPRIGICAVNPHASDGGLFGSEEEELLRPAVDQLKGENLSVEGPFPADTIFRRALEGELDAVVAPYHDVGMAAFKSVSFGTGVNVTLGLPFIRTSPDHGTAFDIAGSGTADPTSTREAILLAARLARRRFDTHSGHK
ncbi:MAG: 4-hydroxythreonine-4-phosphate dehydrogenase PdxA [Gemmatimonadetes bacterium]|nr:4-hydroxythreonine-4-phosphate dehydrogenase PdxA [Gemmatimonadota bacterium]NNM06350.1 4-hydroxythreonine-4-phosphate dehydrogenase PdxA [Gemmatimonadota bacterium]